MKISNILINILLAIVIIILIISISFSMIDTDLRIYMVISSLFYISLIVLYKKVFESPEYTYLEKNDPLRYWRYFSEYMIILSFVFLPIFLFLSSSSIIGPGVSALMMDKTIMMAILFLAFLIIRSLTFSRILNDWAEAKKRGFLDVESKED